MIVDGQLVKPTVPEALPVVDAFYALPGNGLGGACHIVLEDPNPEDWCVDICRRHAATEGDQEGVAMACLLRRMSRTQRAKLRMRHGYPDEDESRRAEFWDLIRPLIDAEPIP